MNIDNLRNTLKETFSNVLKENTVIEDVPSIVKKIGANIEIAIFNYTIQKAEELSIVKKWENKAFMRIYIDHSRTIYNNLKFYNGNFWIRKLIQQEIHPNEFVFLSHQELFPEKWKDNIERKLLKDASKFIVNIEASTDIFTCKRCKSKKCTYYELQTRSADEAITLFITCLDCGKKWKQ